MALPNLILVNTRSQTAILILEAGKDYFDLLAVLVVLDRDTGTQLKATTEIPAGCAL